MFEWVKRRKKMVIGLYLFLLLGIPFITHCLFKIKLNESFWTAEWTAGEILAYFSSILLFGATVILSFLALWQNEIIRQESNKHTQLLVEMERNKSCPFFIVSYISEGIDHNNINISLENVSDNNALNVKISWKNPTYNEVIECEEFFYIITPHSTKKFGLNNNSWDINELIQLNICCTDIYGVKIQFAVDGKYNMSTSIFEFNTAKVNT